MDLKETIILRIDTDTKVKLMKAAKKDKRSLSNYLRIKLDEVVNDINYIPLSEEILLKCGFNQRGDGIMKTEEYYISFFELYKVGGDHSKYQFGINGVVHNVFIEYLHQLKKLYSAFTGKELKINT